MRSIVQGEILLQRDMNIGLKVRVIGGQVRGRRELANSH